MLFCGYRTVRNLAWRICTAKRVLVSHMQDWCNLCGEWCWLICYIGSVSDVVTEEGIGRGMHEVREVMRKKGSYCGWTRSLHTYIHTHSSRST